MTDIFVVGAFHWDVVVDAPRMPDIDETLFGSSVAYRFGGKGGNQAVAAARMGARVAMAGRVGADAFGASVLSALDAAGVDRAQVRVVDGETGMSVALVLPSGDYSAVVVSGVNAGLDPADIALGDAPVLILQNEVAEAVNLALAARCQAARVVLNAAPARPMEPALLNAVDVLIVNQVEAAQLTGVDADGLDPPAAARRLAAMGPPAVIVTLGAAGSVGIDQGTVFEMPVPVRSAGSSHGAGDAFVGAFAAGLADGEDVHAAARFATLAAAHFVQTPVDARMDITRADVLAWAARLPA